MKKTFLVILVVLFNLNNFVFAEDLNGIWEAKFGDSKEQVISVMEARGWNVEKNEDNYLSFKKTKGTYGQKEVFLMEFYFYKAKFYKTIVGVTCSKYDNIQDLTETFVYKYKCKEITDGYKTSLYRSENGNSFYVEESSSSKYSNFYYLAIFDTAINKQVNDEEKEKTRNYILEDL